MQEARITKTKFWSSHCSVIHTQVRPADPWASAAAAPVSCSIALANGSGCRSQPGGKRTRNAVLESLLPPCFPRTSACPEDAALLINPLPPPPDFHSLGHWIKSPFSASQHLIRWHLDLAGGTSALHSDAMMCGVLPAQRLSPSSVAQLCSLAGYAPPEWCPLSPPATGGSD